MLLREQRYTGYPMESSHHHFLRERAEIDRDVCFPKSVPRCFVAMVGPLGCLPTVDLSHSHPEGISFGRDIGIKL